MLIKINFMYYKEQLSFLNKSFTIGAIAFYILVLLAGCFASDFVTTILMLGIIGLVYLGFLIKTIKIKKEYKSYAENGMKCMGTIKDMMIDESSYRDSDGMRRTIEKIYLIVEYLNPYTGKLEQVKTERVNGNPFTYLSSLAVTVYALENGKTLVTDFKRINKLRDSVKYRTDEKYRTEIDHGGKNRFKSFLFSMFFAFGPAILTIKFGFVGFIVAFAIIAICVICMLLKKRK